MRARGADEERKSKEKAMKTKKKDSDDDPKSVVRHLLKAFPNMASDLKQLLEFIDGGKAVDIAGIAHKSLIKPLTALFVSLHLKQLDSGAFVLPPHAPPTLELIGSMIAPPLHDVEVDEVPCPPRKPIGPEMPTMELLAAAAKLREAEAELRAAESEEKAARLGFIGPAQRAHVEAKGESLNHGDGFKEVTRIMKQEDDSAYHILGADRNVTADNIKRRYLKLSLLVHPDKCSHVQASQAFVKLNKAFKELQDPEKRRALDEKIGRMSGMCKTGVKSARKRDAWMTELPPQKKSCSGWNDVSSERVRKSKMEYSQAYNEFMSLSLSEEERKRSLEAELMDRYNKEKRPKSLLQKHKEEIRAKRLKRKHSEQEVEEEDWVGKHPWRPWDREKDLAGSRKSMKMDLENMTQGSSSRFSKGSYQRNFL